MNKLRYVNVSQLNEEQYTTYNQATIDAYPEFLVYSEWIDQHWDKLANYFPEFQVILLNESNNLIGFINAVPIHLDIPLTELPDEGWDWLFMKSIQDYEKSISPNCLGGIQINVLPEYRGQGYSKTLLQKAKNLLKENGFSKYILPIRPNMKWKFPNMLMEKYMHYKEAGKIYDPWIRTHLQAGAEVLHVCNKSMHVSGNIDFWRKMTGFPVIDSTPLVIDGALNPIIIDYPRNIGVYNEENIWIYYTG